MCLVISVARTRIWLVVQSNEARSRNVRFWIEGRVDGVRAMHLTPAHAWGGGQPEEVQGVIVQVAREQVDNDVGDVPQNHALHDAVGERDEEEAGEGRH